MHEQGRLVAGGSYNGTVTLLELSDGLCTLQRNEKASMTAVCCNTIVGSISKCRVT